MRPSVVGRKTFIDAADTVAFQDFDHLAVTLKITTPIKFRRGFDDRPHLGKNQRGLQLVESAGVDFAADLAFRPEQVTQCEASQQTGFAIPSRLALDGNADLSPTVSCDTTIDGLDKAALAGQQLHLLAGVDAFGYRQALEESNDAAHTRALAFPGSRRGWSDVALRLSCVRTA